MKRVEEPAWTENEKNDHLQEGGLLKRLGSLADYTTPAMKELLFYGAEKMNTPGSPV